MIATPKISVVMPVWNGEKYLREAIDSILSQTLADFELIVVDDGSTDSTPAILASYRDERIRTFRVNHLGFVGAINTGIAQARAHWLARHDADDISYPQRLQKQWNAVQADKSAVLCFTNYAYFGDVTAASGLQYCSRSRALLALRLCYQNPIVHSTVLLKKSALDAVGGYRPEETQSEDFSLWGRMIEAGNLLALTEPLVKLRVHPASASRVNAEAVRQWALQIAVRHCHTLMNLDTDEAARLIRTLETAPAQRSWSDWCWLVRSGIPRLRWKSLELGGWILAQTARMIVRAR